MASSTLRRDGINFEQRAEDFARGILVLDFIVPIENDAPIALVAAFPDLYPYVRPEVYAPALDLARHQNPFGKNLCLLGRRSDAWLPEMTLADLIREQLAKVPPTRNRDAPSRAPTTVSA